MMKRIAFVLIALVLLVIYISVCIKASQVQPDREGAKRFGKTVIEWYIFTQPTRDGL